MNHQIKKRKGQKNNLILQDGKTSLQKIFINHQNKKREGQNSIFNYQIS